MSSDEEGESSAATESEEEVPAEAASETEEELNACRSAKKLLPSSATLLKSIDGPEKITLMTKFMASSAHSWHQSTRTLACLPVLLVCIKIATSGGVFLPISGSGRPTKIPS